MDYHFIKNAEQYFDERGCLDWFWIEGLSGKHRFYIVNHEMNHIPYLPVNVLEVRPIGQEEVFDISVAQTESFVASGITVHNCIPSRMTIGQLVEEICSKTYCIEGISGKFCTPFEPFSIEKIEQKLHNLGFNRFGNEVMYNPYTGKIMAHNVFICPVRYQKLKHMVYDKIHCRARGQYTILTRQPMEGRSRGGELKIGEMERDCIISHGCTAVLRDRLCLSSDKYEMPVCAKCGLIAIANDDKTECKRCKSVTNVYRVQIPYACKLLFQELMACCIVPRIRLLE